MVRGHSRKKDMPLLLVLCVPFIAAVREPSTCARKIQKLGFICGARGQGTQALVSDAVGSQGSWLLTVSLTVSMR